MCTLLYGVSLCLWWLSLVGGVMKKERCLPFFTVFTFVYGVYVYLCLRCLPVFTVLTFVYGV